MHAEGGCPHLQPGPRTARPGQQFRVEQLPRDTPAATSSSCAAGARLRGVVAVILLHVAAGTTGGATGRARQSRQRHMPLCGRQARRRPGHVPLRGRQARRRPGCHPAGRNPKGAPATVVVKLQDRVAETQRTQDCFLDVQCGDVRRPPAAAAAPRTVRRGCAPRLCDSGWDTGLRMQLATPFMKNAHTRTAGVTFF